MALNHTDKRVKHYMESKDSDEVARRVALLYLLNSIAIAYHEEIDDTCRKYGLVHHDLKFRSANLQNAFNAYNRVMMEMMTPEANKLMAIDYEDLKAQCDKFLANPYIPENHDTD